MSNSPVNPVPLTIRPLAREDVEAAVAFSCGDDDLDDFLRTDAMRLQDQSAVRTFLAIYEGEIVGYIALLADAVTLKSSERKKLALSYDDHPIVPAVKVARLGVRTDHKGRGVRTLMYFAYSTAGSCGLRRMPALDA